MVRLQTQRRVSLFPGVAPRGQPVVLQPAALRKLLLEEALVRCMRVPAVRACLTQD